MKVRWALVTGASDGIGEAMCHQLAKRGINVVMVARTKKKLLKVAEYIQSMYGVDVEIICRDFSEELSVEFFKEVKDVMD